MKPLWRLLLLLFGLLAWRGGLAGPDGPVALGHQDRVALAPHLRYLEDPDRSLKVTDLAADPARARWRPVQSVDSSGNFGASHSAIWLRLELQAQPGAPLDWLIEIANPALDRLDLYVADGRGGFAHSHGGDLRPYAERDPPHRHLVKPVRLLPEGPTTILLRVESEGTVSVPATLWRPQALWARDQGTYAGFGLYFGLLLGLLLYNLLLFTAVRDPAYLVYVGFVGFMGLSQAVNSGLAVQFLWPEATWWNSRALNALNALSGLFGTWFAASFLGTRRSMPWLDRWIRLLIALWALGFVVSLAAGYRSAVLAVTLLAAAGVVTVAAAAILAVLRRQPGAAYFALAWGVLLAGVTILTLHNNGLLPSNLFTSNALLIGSALEMVLLSFALAWRINTARKEKEQAQAQIASEQAVVQALQQSQARYQAVIEHVAEGMLVLLDGQSVFVNARAAEILGESREQLLAQGALRCVHAEDRERLVDRLRRRLAGETLPDRIEVRIQGASGPERWIELGDTAITWDGRAGLLVFFLDVTERRQAERDTREALSRQQELNALRSRFVSMTSHEFRTPLATIQSSHDLLRHYLDRLPEAERTELLAAIEASVQRMTAMLDRVLLLGKAEAQMLEFDPRPLDLAALCRTLLQEAALLPGASACELRMESEGAADGRLYDEKLLRHALGNLLSNAIKYSPRGGRVTLRLRAESDATVIEVQDEGIGIPQAELAHLFESFHRASNVGDIRGTGLGLAIVKNAVDLHGGTIAVESEEGRGTCFCLRLAAGPA